MNNPAQIPEFDYSSSVLEGAGKLDLPLRNFIWIKPEEIAQVYCDGIITDVDLTMLEDTPRWVHDGPSARFASATIQCIEEELKVNQHMNSHQRKILERMVEGYRQYCAIEEKVYHSKDKMDHEQIKIFLDSIIELKDVKTEKELTSMVQHFFHEKFGINFSPKPAHSLVLYLREKQHIYDLREKEGKIVEFFHGLSLLALEEKNIHSVTDRHKFLELLRLDAEINTCNFVPSWARTWGLFIRHAGKSSKDICDLICEDLQSLTTIFTEEGQELPGITLDSHDLCGYAQDVIKDNPERFAEKLSLVPGLEHVINPWVKTSCCTASPQDVIGPLLAQFQIGQCDAYGLVTRYKPIFDAKKKDKDAYSGRPIRHAAEGLEVDPRSAVMIGDGAVDYLSSIRTEFGEGDKKEKVGVGLVILRIPTCPITEHPQEWESHYIGTLIEARAFHNQFEVPAYGRSSDPNYISLEDSSFDGDDDPTFKLSSVCEGPCPHVLIVSDFSSIQLMGRSNGDRARVEIILRD